MKIMELHYNGKKGEEQYTIKVEKGFSKLQAAAHMFRAVAEGLEEIQEALLWIPEQLEEAKDN